MSNSTKKVSSDDTSSHISRSLRHEITHRRHGLPATRTPERKTNKSINNKINNKTSRKISKNNNNNNNNYKNNSAHVSNSQKSTRSNCSNSKINSDKSTSNVNNKTNTVNDNGITSSNNTSPNTNSNKLDSTISRKRSEVDISVRSTADDGGGRGGDGGGGEGGGHEAGEEAWPCPTPCPTRCPSLDEESTFELREASINAAINSAISVVKTVAQEGARAVLVDAARQLQEDMKTSLKDILEGVKPNAKEETENMEPQETEEETKAKMNGMQEAVKPYEKEEIGSTTVSPEIEVKARDSEKIELKGKEGKTNIVSAIMPKRLSRVAISLPDDAKSQFLKIRHWHVNKKGHLVLDCSLPLGGNEGAAKMEMSETPISKDAVKCHIDLSATENLVTTPVFSRILKNGCIDPTVLSQPPSVNMNNSEKTNAPPTNLLFEARTTTKSTSQGSPLSLGPVDAASAMTSPPLGVTLTFTPSKTKDVASPATLTPIPITISTMSVNHTTVVPLNSIAMEQQYLGDQDPDLHCLRRNPTSLEDLLAVLRATCALSAEASTSGESVYAHKPRRKPGTHRTGTRRRESCWRRPCSVLRALAVALRLSKSPICEDGSLRHGVGTSDAYEDDSDLEGGRQHAANTRGVAGHQTSQKRYQWSENEADGSDGEAGWSRSSHAPPCARENAILVDTGCNPRSREAQSRPPPSPVENVPCKCPDEAISTEKARDGLDGSAKSIASHDKVNQGSVESIKREPSNTCNTFMKLRMRESPTHLPVRKELPQPQKVITKTKKMQSPSAPECPWCPKNAGTNCALCRRASQALECPWWSKNATTNCAMCQRTAAMPWGKGGCSLCNHVASKSCTRIPKKPSNVSASRTLMASTAERRGDKGHAAPVRPKPVPARVVQHSSRTQKRQAPKSRDRSLSMHRSVTAKHRSVSGRRGAKHRSASRSQKRKRSQSNSRRGTPRSISQSLRRKQSVSNRYRIRSLSQPQRQQIHFTPHRSRGRTRSVSGISRGNQNSTSSSLHRLIRSRSQSQNRKQRSTSKARGAPHRSLWKTNRAPPSGASCRPTTRVRAGTRRRQLNAVPLRRTVGQRVVSNRRGTMQTQRVYNPKGLRRPQGILVIQKRPALQKSSHRTVSATSLSSGSSISSGSSTSSGSSRGSASASSTDSRIGALRDYCATRDPKSIRACILRHILEAKTDDFAPRPQPCYALTGPSAKAPTASRSTVRVLKKGGK